MMNERVVEAEILDGLPADDPEAARSRRDLRRLNAVMGNHRWLRGKLRAGERVVEIGAGEGDLARRFAAGGVGVTGLDLVGEPAGLPEGVAWVSGDCFETLGTVSGDVIVGCLVLHHFEGGALRRLGELIEAGEYGRVLATEPYRAWWAMGEGAVVTPFVNRVTRHDMFVSIRAGFRGGELGFALGMDSSKWDVWESVTIFGAYRFEAVRKG
ncbi:MAG: hypothetical protein AAGD22_09135 [Verrucomicrobiota bacterium]